MGTSTRRRIAAHQRVLHLELVGEDLVAGRTYEMRVGIERLLRGVAVENGGYIKQKHNLFLYGIYLNAVTVLG